MTNLQAGDHFDLLNGVYAVTECLIDVPSKHGNITVYRAFTKADEPHHYVVTVDDIVRHPNCTAEDVIRALGNYLIQF